ncbi:uncharacterized protein LOC126991567 [Eriocheir sinensis]|uniref:uncharacterized protein LOC126991567 n=1 Tax=Eriocheir sinensis TaxID=95602 RepID=UPI0021C9CEE0|nr:uncharacterized protein LOC126991567 [Eriocheir sinensis]
MDTCRRREVGAARRGRGGGGGGGGAVEGFLRDNRCSLSVSAKQWGEEECGGPGEGSQRRCAGHKGGKGAVAGFLPRLPVQVIPGESSRWKERFVRQTGGRREAEAVNAPQVLHHCWMGGNPDGKSYAGQEQGDEGTWSPDVVDPITKVARNYICRAKQSLGSSSWSGIMPF